MWIVRSFTSNGADLIPMPLNLIIRSNRLSEVSQAVRSFYNEMVTQGMAKCNYTYDDRFWSHDESGGNGRRSRK